MEELSFALFVVIVMLIVSLKSDLKKRLSSLELEMKRLREEIGSSLPAKHPPSPGEAVLPDVVAAAPVVNADPPLTGPLHEKKEKSLSEELSELLRNARNETDPPVFMPEMQLQTNHRQLRIIRTRIMKLFPVQENLPLPNVIRILKNSLAKILSAK